MSSFIKQTTDHEHMYKGLKKITDPIISTMGPSKSTTMIMAGANVIPSQDGFRISKYQLPKDQFHQIIYRLIVDALTQTVSNAGDGTTTCSLLIREAYRAFIDSRKRMEEEGEHFVPIECKRGIDSAVANIIASIDSIKKEIYKDGVLDENALLNVATVATSGDKEIAKVISDLIAKIGVDGVIEVVASDDGTTKSSVSPGYTFPGGVPGMNFYNGPKGLSLNDCFIALINQPLSELDQIRGVIEHYAKVAGRSREPLVIICPQVDMSLSSQIYRNLKENQLPIFLVKAPGADTKHLMEDLKIITQTYGIYDMGEGYQLKDFGKNDISCEFGRVKKIHCTTTKTTIIYSEEKKTKNDLTLKEEIANRVEYFRELIESDKSNADKYKHRIALLVNGIGKIYVGGSSNTEFEHLIDPIEDAQLACFSAIDQGILPGGSKAFNHAISQFKEPKGSLSFLVGYNAMYQAIKGPLQQIGENCGLSEDELDKIYADTLEHEWRTYDMANMAYVNAFEAGIIDPYKVVITGIKSAASVVKYLTTTKYFQVQNG